MSRSIQLGSREITDESRPYIIAEIGVNYEGSMDRAKELIDLAAAGGADAAKFQSYKAETIAAKNSPAYWDLNEEPTTSQFELFKKHDSFNEAEYKELAAHCEKVGITFLSTPFDDVAVDFLDPLMPFYKVASADLTNTPFLRKIAAKGKPVLLSTGAANLSEIDLALRELKAAGARDIGLLHCVLNYPTDYENANIGMIRHLRDLYPELTIGYSDHTKPDQTMLALVTATTMGARIIEKHFTFDKSLRGNDHYHAADREDLLKFRGALDELYQLTGEYFKRALPSEDISRKNARRSIVVNGGVRAGDVFNAQNLTYKRPAHGISPIHWDEVLGRKAARDMEDDTILQWADVV